MKIQCYREQHTLDGVSVVKLSSAEIPVSEVLEQRLVDVTHHEQEATTCDQDGAHGAPPAPQRFRYRIGDSPQEHVVETEGMIIANGDASLSSFLEHRFVPDEGSDRKLDRLLVQLRAGEITRSDWLRIMEQEIMPDRKASFHRRLRFDSDIPPCPAFVAHWNSIRRDFEERHDEAGTYLVRSLSDDAPMAVVVPFAEQVCGSPVPRWRFTIAGEYDESVGGWDGRRYRTVRQFSDLPDSLCRATERDGRVVSQPGDWFVPLPDLQPEILIRVPYAAEVADIVDAGPPPRTEELRRPSFLVDSRRPVVLRDRAQLDVVEDPELAISVLTRRTSRGAFVPAMPPAPVADIDFSPEGQPAQYVVGCWFR